ncbi:hypothetical protein CR513_10336, partial [Mucuna pruriens]
MVVVLLEGGGRFANVTFLDAKVSPSLLPNGISKTASRAARAVMSAHETTLPQAFSKRPRRSSIILKASALKVKFGGASFSLGPLADPSNKTDPSQPYRYIFYIHGTKLKRQTTHQWSIRASFGLV